MEIDMQLDMKQMWLFDLKQASNEFKKYNKSDVQTS